MEGFEKKEGGMEDNTVNRQPCIILTPLLDGNDTENET